MQLAGQSDQLDLVGRKLEALGDCGGVLAHAVGMAADVRVARVDGSRQGCRSLEARRAVGIRCQPLELRHRRHVGAVDAHAVLALALCPVERDVGDADELGALDAVLRERRHAGREADGAAVLGLGAAEVADELVADAPCRLLAVAGEHECELIAAQPERLTRVAQPGRDLREHLVARRVAVAVVDLLEVVEVEQHDRQRQARLLGAFELRLQLLLEVPMVAEPGERVGLRQAHGAQRVVRRALMQCHRDQRAGESDCERRRLRPERDEREGDRGHDRERDGSAEHRRREHDAERLARPARDDAGDQGDVHEVEGERAEDDLQDPPPDRLLQREEVRRQAGRRTGDRVDGAVVDQLDERALFGELERDTRDQPDDDGRFPAEEDAGAEDEDCGQRDAARGQALDRDRVRLGEDRRGEQDDDPCGAAGGGGSEAVAPDRRPERDGTGKRDRQEDRQQPEGLGLAETPAAPVHQPSRGVRRRPLHRARPTRRSRAASRPCRMPPLRRSPESRASEA